MNYFFKQVKLLIGFPAQCNKEHVFQSKIIHENWHVRLATAQRRGWIFENGTLTWVSGNNEKSKATSNQLCWSCALSARIYFPSSFICTSTAISGYLYCNVMLLRLSHLCPLSPLCSFTVFPTTLSFVLPQTSCTNLPRDNLLLTLSLVLGVEMIISVMKDPESGWLYGFTCQSVKPWMLLCQGHCWELWQLSILRALQCKEGCGIISQRIFPEGGFRTRKMDKGRSGMEGNIMGKH